MTARQKTEILVANPTCRVCGLGFEEGAVVEFDHTIPLALGGSNELANFCPLHEKCHEQKTVEDMKRIAKAKRLEAVRKGSKRKKGGWGGRGKRKIPSRPFRRKQEKL